MSVENRTTAIQIMSLLINPGTEKQRVFARFPARNEGVRTNQIAAARRKHPDAELGLLGPFVDGSSSTGGFAKLADVPLVIVPKEFAR